LSKDVEKTLSVATLHSYIIKIGERKNRKSNRRDAIYQLNGIIATRWDLPIYKRGDIELSSNEALAIFSPGGESLFEACLKERSKRYNFPFGKTMTETTPSFF